MLYIGIDLGTSAVLFNSDGASTSLTFSIKKDISLMFEDNLSVKDLQVLADALHKSHGGIRAVLSETDNGFLFCICSDNNLDGFFRKFKTAFNVGR